MTEIQKAKINMLVEHNRQLEQDRQQLQKDKRFLIKELQRYIDLLANK